MKITQDHAQVIAINAVGWLVTQDEVCHLFLASSGSQIEDIKQQLGDPSFLASIMDFIALQDPWVIACCDAIKLPHEHFMVVRHSLEGQEVHHWT